MSRDAAVIEISSESDSDIECSADYPNPFDANSKIEVIDDEDDDDDTSDDDDVKIVSITPPAAPLSIAAPAPPAPAPVKTGGYISTLTIGWSRIYIVVAFHCR